MSDMADNDERLGEVAQCIAALVEARAANDHHHDAGAVDDACDALVQALDKWGMHLLDAARGRRPVQSPAIEAAHARIVRSALQVARLETIGMYVADGALTHPSDNDVRTLIESFRHQVFWDARLVLGLMSRQGGDS